MECSMCIFMLCFYIGYIAKPLKVSVSVCNVFMLCWLGYIIMHGVSCDTTEWYRTIYLCVTLLFFLMLSFSMSTMSVRRTYIINGLLLILNIHIIFILGQSIGILDSSNEFFQIAGSNDNPTVTAIYIVGCIPIIANSIAKGYHRKYMIILLIASLISIIALECRTAYIGLFVEVVAYIIFNDKTRSAIKEKLCRNKILYLFLLMLVMSATAKMYYMKKDSADGRLLIWRLSAEMIADKPLGHGYGQYERTYNLFQSEYFTNEISTESERQNAGHVITAYNDYLEHGVEGGIIGMAFIVCFYAISVRKAFKQKRFVELSILSAYAVMSLTNFIVATVQPWLLVGCVCALLQSPIDNNSSEANFKYSRAMAVTLFTLIGIFTYKTIRMTTAQISLCRIRQAINMGVFINDNEFSKIEHNIGSSEAFWNVRAENALNSKHVEKALSFTLKASTYTSAPQVYYNLGELNRILGRQKESIRYMRILSNMLPNRLYPKFALLKLYANNNDIASALAYAKAIIACIPKVESDLSNRIQREASIYIKNHNQRE